LSIVVVESIAVKIAVLEALDFAPPDTVHALAAFLGFFAAALRLPLADADAPGLECATAKGVGYHCLPGASTFVTMEQAVSGVKVFVLADLTHTVSPSFTL